MFLFVSSFIGYFSRSTLFRRVIHFYLFFVYYQQSHGGQNSNLTCLKSAHLTCYADNGGIGISLNR